MPDQMIPLTEMRIGQKGTVIEIQGGQGFAERLSAMGIRPGKKITKIGSMFMHGPVTVQVDRTQVAIGFGMAKKLIIEPDKQ